MTHSTTLFSPGSSPVSQSALFDDFYTDYEWFRRLTEEEVHFVTRLKENAAYLVLEQRRPVGDGVRADEIIAMEKQAQADIETAPFLRRVRYWDEATQRELAEMGLAAVTDNRICIS